jgi:hypothetical protein
MTEPLFLTTFHMARIIEIALIYVRFQVLTVASMKITVFWDIAPCRLVEIDRRSRDSTHH